MVNLRPNFDHNPRDDGHWDQRGIRTGGNETRNKNRLKNRRHVPRPETSPDLLATIPPVAGIHKEALVCSRTRISEIGPGTGWMNLARANDFAGGGWYRFEPAPPPGGRACLV